jgi:hypothetical protein
MSCFMCNFPRLPFAKDIGFWTRDETAYAIAQDKWL